MGGDGDGDGDGGGGDGDGGGGDGGGGLRLGNCEGPEVTAVAATVVALLVKEKWVSSTRASGFSQASARASRITPSPLEKGELSDRETNGRAERRLYLRMWSATD